MSKSKYVFYMLAIGLLLLLFGSLKIVTAAITYPYVFELYSCGANCGSYPNNIAVVAFDTANPDAATGTYVLKVNGSTVDTQTTATDISAMLKTPDNTVFSVTFTEGNDVTAANTTVDITIGAQSSLGETVDSFSNAMMVEDVQTDIGRVYPFEATGGGLAANQLIVWFDVPNADAATGTYILKDNGGTPVDTALSATDMYPDPGQVQYGMWLVEFAGGVDITTAGYTVDITVNNGIATARGINSYADAMGELFGGGGGCTGFCVSTVQANGSTSTNLEVVTITFTGGGVAQADATVNSTASYAVMHNNGYASTNWGDGVVSVDVPARCDSGSGYYTCVDVTFNRSMYSGYLYVSDSIASTTAAALQNGGKTESSSHTARFIYPTDDGVFRILRATGSVYNTTGDAVTVLFSRAVSGIDLNDTSKFSFGGSTPDSVYQPTLYEAMYYFNSSHPVTGGGDVNLAVTNICEDSNGASCLTDTVTIVAGQMPTYDDGTLNTNYTRPALSVTTSGSPAEPSTNGQFTISNANLVAVSGDLAVHYTMSGTATNGIDYTNLSGTAIITSGTSSTTIGLFVTDDEDAEDDETVILTLVADPAYSIVSGQDTLTIIDNEAGLPEISVSVNSANDHASEPSHNGTFTLQIDQVLASNLTIYYTISGTATNGTDYEALSGSTTITAGNSGGPLTVTPTDDGDTEGLETIILTLTSNANYGINQANPAATMNLGDDETPPELSVSTTGGVTTVEGMAVTAFVISADRYVVGPITVLYSMTGTAASGVDYSAFTGSANLLLSTGSSLTLTTTEDYDMEDDETVILTLTADPAYTIAAGQGSATITILDNDAVPEVAISGTTSVNEGIGASFTVTATEAVEGNFNVYYTVSGTATSGTDFSALSGTATIITGFSQATVNISITEDNDVEANETIIITITTDATYNITGGSESATITIEDNDDPIIGNNATNNWGTYNLGDPVSVVFTNTTCPSGCDLYVFSPQNALDGITVNRLFYQSGITSGQFTAIGTDQGYVIGTGTTSGWSAGYYLAMIYDTSAGSGSNIIKIMYGDTGGGGMPASNTFFECGGFDCDGAVTGETGTATLSGSDYIFSASGSIPHNPGMDGTYVAGGTYGGESYYQYGSYYIYWVSTDSVWALSDELGDSNSLYLSDDSTLAGTWSYWGEPPFRVFFWFPAGNDLTGASMTLNIDAAPYAASNPVELAGSYTDNQMWYLDFDNSVNIKNSINAAAAVTIDVTDGPQGLEIITLEALMAISGGASESFDLDLSETTDFSSNTSMLSTSAASFYISKDNTVEGVENCSVVGCDYHFFTVDELGGGLTANGTYNLSGNSSNPYNFATSNLGGVADTYYVLVKDTTNSVWSEIGNVIFTITSEAGYCEDTLDNDGDSSTDCSDSDCSADPACAAPSITASLAVSSFQISGAAEPEISVWYSSTASSGRRYAEVGEDTLIGIGGDETTCASGCDLYIFEPSDLSLLGGIDTNYTYKIAGIMDTAFETIETTAEGYRIGGATTGTWTAGYYLAALYDTGGAEWSRPAQLQVTDTTYPMIYECGGEECEVDVSEPTDRMYVEFNSPTDISTATFTLHMGGDYEVVGATDARAGVQGQEQFIWYVDFGSSLDIGANLPATVTITGAPGDLNITSYETAITEWNKTSGNFSAGTGGTQGNLSSYTTTTASTLYIGDDNKIDCSVVGCDYYIFRASDLADGIVTANGGAQMYASIGSSADPLTFDTSNLDGSGVYFVIMRDTTNNLWSEVGLINFSGSNDVALSITVTGSGTPPYSIAISDPAMNPVASYSGVSSFPYTPTLTNMSAGRYVITVADSGFLIGTVTFYVYEAGTPILITSSSSYTSAPITLAGTAASINEGTLTYALKDGAGTTVQDGGQDITGTFASGSSFSDAISSIANGTYYLHITDSLSNTEQMQITINVATTETSCTDSIDNEGDGYTDCADSECNGLQGSGGICQYLTETTCNDGFDNDADTMTDGADSDCAVETCNNSVDDDSDTFTDCADSDCNGQLGPGGFTCQYGTETSCSDGFDNDADGLADGADTDCAPSEICNNTIDDDSDTFIDCADSDCNGQMGPGGFTCQYGIETACSDGFDNDADGMVDGADSDCALTLEWFADYTSAVQGDIMTAHVVEESCDSNCTFLFGNSSTVELGTQFHIEENQGNMFQIDTQYLPPNETLYVRVYNGSTYSNALVVNVGEGTTIDEQYGMYMSPLVVNEVMFSPAVDYSTGGFNNNSPGGSATAAEDEWIEIYIAEDSVSLTNYYVQYFDTGWNTGPTIECRITYNGSAVTCVGQNGKGGFDAGVFTKGTTLLNESVTNAMKGAYLVLGNPTVSLGDKSKGSLEIFTINGYFQWVDGVMWGSMGDSTDSNWETLSAPNTGQSLQRDKFSTNTFCHTCDFSAENPSIGAVNAYESELKVFGVFPMGAGSVGIDFTKPLDTATILPGNFSVQSSDGQQTLTVTSAQIEEGTGGRTVVLSLSGMQGDINYLITISGNLHDEGGTGLNVTNREFYFRGYEEDTSPPEIIDAYMNGGRNVEIFFNEDVEIWGTGHNVQISPTDTEDGVNDLAVTGKWKMFNGMNIEFNKRLVAGVTYTITLTGITDFAMPTANILASPNNTVTITPINLATFDDGQPLEIVKTLPFERGSISASATAVMLYFNKPVDYNSFENNIYLYDFSSAGVTLTAITSDNYTYLESQKILMVNIGMTAGHEYEVQIMNTTDYAGNMIRGGMYRLSFFATAADGTAPLVSYVGIENTMPVATKHLEVCFNEDMDAGSIYSTNAGTASAPIILTTIVSGSVSYAAGNTSYNTNGKCAVFAIQERLKANTSYTFTVTKSVKDAAGNALANQYTKTFETQIADTTAPRVEFMSCTTSVVEIGFSEPMNDAQVANRANYSLQSPIGTSKSLTNTSFNYDGQLNVLRISGITLQKGSECQIIVSNVTDFGGGNIIDQSANSFISRVNDISDQFFEMRIIESHPFFNNWNVPTNLKTITLLFNRGLNSNSLDKDSVKLYKLVNGTQTLVSDESSDLSFTYYEKKKGLDITLAASLLEASTEYKLQLVGPESDYSNCVQSDQGNCIPFSLWMNFATSSGTNTAAATASIVSPQNGATGVSTTAPIEIRFSTPIPAAIASSNYIYLAPTASIGSVDTRNASTFVAADYEYFPPEKRVTIFPRAPLSVGTEYTARVVNNFPNSRGVLGSQTSFTFTTSGTGDTVAPYVEWVQCDTFGCRIIFSEVVKKDLASNLDNYTLLVSNDGSPSITIPLTGKNYRSEVWDGKSEIRIDGLDLNKFAASGGSYKMTASSKIKDLAGNALSTSSDSSNTRGCGILAYNSCQNYLINSSDKHDNTFMEYIYPGPMMRGIPNNLSNIEIAFNNEIDTSTLTTALAGDSGLYEMGAQGSASGFNPVEYLLSGNATEVGVSYSSGTRKISLSVNTALKNNYFYCFALTNEVLDANGNAIISPPDLPKDLGVIAMTCFYTSGTTQANAPEIMGTNIDWLWDGSLQAFTGVPSYQPYIELFFKDPINFDSSKIQIVDVLAGNSTVKGYKEYFSRDKKVTWTPRESLQPDKTYKIIVDSSLTTLTGGSLSGNIERIFTTSEATDTEAPRLDWVECEEFECRLFFSEPIVSASTGDINYQNLSIKNPYSNGSGPSVNLSSKPFEWPQPHMLKIRDLSLKANTEYYIEIDAGEVEDNSGNPIDNSSRTFQGYIESTYSFVNEFDKSVMATGDKMFYDFSPWQANAQDPTAAATSTYFINMPVDQAAKGLEITFGNSGFDVSNAAMLPCMFTTQSAESSPMNCDINGPAPKSITVSGMTKNNSAKKLVLTFSETTNARDFVSIDIKGIRNPGPGTYDVTLQPLNAEGRPISAEQKIAKTNISPQGNASITLNVSAPDIGDGTTTTAYLGGKAVTLTFTSGQATHTFSGLNPMFYDIQVKGPSGYYDEGRGIQIVNPSAQRTESITLHATDASTMNGRSTVPVAVNITGGNANSKVQFRGGNMYGESYEQEVTLNASGAASMTFNVIEDEQYWMEIMPFMAKTTTTKDFGFMPPPPKNLFANGFKDADESTADTITFNLGTGDMKYIEVTVTDASGNAVQNAMVTAAGRMPKATGALGKAKLIAFEGLVFVDVIKPGVGEVFGIPVEVASANTENSPATVTVPMVVPGRTLSGSVKADANTLQQNALVFANERDSNGNPMPGHKEIFSTDGSYSFRVRDNTRWQICAFDGTAETCLPDQVVVGTADSTGNTIYVKQGFVSVTGTLEISGTGVPDAYVSIESNTSTPYYGGVVTDVNGAYSLSVPSGQYCVRAFVSKIIDGKKININKNISCSVDTSSGDTVALGTTSLASSTVSVPISFINEGGSAVTVTNAFVNVESITGKRSDFQIKGASSSTMGLEPGTYTIRGFVEGAGPITTQAGVVVSEGTSLAFTVPSPVTISGTVKDGSGTGVSGAKVQAKDPVEGFIAGNAETNSTGAYTMYVPANLGKVIVTARKTNYTPSEAASLSVAAANLTKNLVITSATNAASQAVTVTLAGSQPSDVVRVVATDAKGNSISGNTNSNGNGQVTLSLPNGTYALKAFYVGYETTAGNTQTVTIANTTSPGAKTIPMTAVAGFTSQRPATTTFNPTTGVTLTSTDGKVIVTIPGGALTGSASTTYRLSVAKIAAPETGVAKTEDGLGYDIAITDSSGQTVTSLNSSIKIEITVDDVNTVNIGYVDDSANGEWSNVSFSKDAVNSKIIVWTDHLTIYGEVIPTDEDPPAAPTGLSGEKSGNTVLLDWNNNTEVDFLEYEVYRSATTPVSIIQGNQVNLGIVTDSAWADLTPPATGTVYYAVTAVDTSGNESTGSSSVPVVITAEATETCNNSVDDDGDLAVDCADSDCTGVSPCGQEICNDGVDNDGDGHKDCADPECDTNPICRPPVDGGDQGGGGGGGGAGDTPSQPKKVTLKVKDIEILEGEELEEAKKKAEKAEAKPPFTDTIGHWGESFIAKLYNKGVIKGRSATTFEPNAQITRAEALKIILLGLGETVPASVSANPFPDVDKGAWYAPVVKKAKDMKIIGGYTDGTFRPDQNVNRAEALKMLFITGGVEVGKVTENPFSDVDAGGWYAPYVLTSYNKGIVKGYDDGTFRAGQSITRAEMSKIVVKVMEM